MIFFFHNQKTVNKHAPSSSPCFLLFPSSKESAIITKSQIFQRVKLLIWVIIIILKECIDIIIVIISSKRIVSKSKFMVIIIIESSAEVITIHNSILMNIILFIIFKVVLNLWSLHRWNWTSLLRCKSWRNIGISTLLHSTILLLLLLRLIRIIEILLSHHLLRLLLPIRVLLLSTHLHSHLWVLLHEIWVHIGIHSALLVSIHGCLLLKLRLLILLLTSLVFVIIFLWFIIIHWAEITLLKHALHLRSSIFLVEFHQFLLTHHVFGSLARHLLTNTLLLLLGILHPHIGCSGIISLRESAHLWLRILLLAITNLLHSSIEILLTSWPTLRLSLLLLGSSSHLLVLLHDLLLSGKIWISKHSHIGISLHSWIVLSSSTWSTSLLLRKLWGVLLYLKSRLVILRALICLFLWIFSFSGLHFLLN